jgi:hypothetical protein
MRLSDLTLITDGVLGLEKGHNDQKPGNEDFVQLLFGGIQTAFTSEEFAEDGSV